MPRRVLTAREQVAMVAPWLRHAAERVDLRWERDGGGDWILVGRNPDGNPIAVRGWLADRQPRRPGIKEP